MDGFPLSSLQPAGCPDGALYYATRMLMAGENADVDVCVMLILGGFHTQTYVARQGYIERTLSLSLCIYPCYGNILGTYFEILFSTLCFQSHEIHIVCCESWGWHVDRTRTWRTILGISREISYQYDIRVYQQLIAVVTLWQTNISVKKHNFDGKTHYK